MNFMFFFLGGKVVEEIFYPRSMAIMEVPGSGIIKVNHDASPTHGPCFSFVCRLSQ